MSNVMNDLTHFDNVFASFSDNVNTTILSYVFECGKQVIIKIARDVLNVLLLNGTN